jgi:hypothetical protein
MKFSVHTAVSPTQMHSTWHALLQNIELMPQDQYFGFQPVSRLEAVEQEADKKEANCDLNSPHAWRMEFSEATTVTPAISPRRFSRWMVFSLHRSL